MLILKALQPLISYRDYFFKLSTYYIVPQKMHNFKELILSNLVKVTRHKQVGYF